MRMRLFEWDTKYWVKGSEATSYAELLLNTYTTVIVFLLYTTLTRYGYLSVILYLANIYTLFQYVNKLK